MYLYRAFNNIDRFKAASKQIKRQLNHSFKRMDQFSLVSPIKNTLQKVIV